MRSITRVVSVEATIAAHFRDYTHYVKATTSSSTEVDNMLIQVRTCAEWYKYVLLNEVQDLMAVFITSLLHFDSSLSHLL